jgi:hypothetical protein
MDAKSGISGAFSSAVTVEEPDEWSGEGRNARYAVSEDLRHITFWQSRADRITTGWQRTEYCFDEAGLQYVECGTSNQVEPPKHLPFAE